MVFSKRQFLADEELGKKDDDHRPRSRSQFWHTSKQWKPLRLRRLLLGAVVLYLIYLFFKNMPTDLTPTRERFNPAVAETRHRTAASPAVPPLPVTPQQGPPPRDGFAPEGGYYYDGKTNLNALTQTLYRYAKPPNAHGLFTSRAVVFAGASLTSVSDLLPLACKMASRKVNDVHFVLMGRDDVSIEGIRRVNGITDTDCPIQWHDGRTDFAQWSTDARMQRAVISGLGYIQKYLSPQVIITQGTPREEAFLLEATEKKSNELGTAHIALPTFSRDLMWISFLDSHSLRAWNDVHIEILIQASPHSSGSLIRLIRSLQNADYLGSTPNLLIELPYEVDPQLLRYLQKMKWPSQTSSKVTLRRHVRSNNLHAMEASLRTVKSFYPRDPNMTHVLMVAPQTEVAPSFYHYLKYTLLKYKYSESGRDMGSRLFGISLELPSSLPTNDKPFDLPEFSNDEKALPGFLWQAPNSNAALYFGDKWIELHSFLSNRFAADTTPAAHTPDKTVSKRYPAIMEYMLELMRARGYFLLYPAFPASGTHALAAVHTDLDQLPEEFSQESSANADEAESVDGSSTPIAVNPAQEVRTGLLSQTSTLMPLLDQLFPNLREMDSLPLLSYRGDVTPDATLLKESHEYLQQFRVRHGGCRESNVEDTTPENLFCGDD